MLLSILIDVQYLQNVIFSFEKDSSGQYHSFSGSHHLVKKSPSKIYLTPTLTGEGRFLPSLNAIWKNLLPPVNPPKKKHVVSDYWGVLWKENYVVRIALELWLNACPWRVKFD